MMAGGVRIALSRDVLIAAQQAVRNDADDASAVTIAAARWQPGAPIRVTLRGSAERSAAHDDRGGASATACAAAYSDVGGPPTQSLDADRKAAADFVETAARCASESEATAAGVASTLRDLEGALQGLEALVGDARARFAREAIDGHRKDPDASLDVGTSPAKPLSSLRNSGCQTDAATGPSEDDALEALAEGFAARCIARAAGSVLASHGTVAPPPTSPPSTSHAQTQTQTHAACVARGAQTEALCPPAPTEGIREERQSLAAERAWLMRVLAARIRFLDSECAPPRVH